MRWFVVGRSPPLACRPSSVAHAQPPGPGLPEQAPSVHTSSTPVAATGASAPPGDSKSPPSQATCAQRRPTATISCPGATAVAHTEQDVAYLAMTGTGQAYEAGAPGPWHEAVACRAQPASAAGPPGAARFALASDLAHATVLGRHPVLCLTPPSGRAVAPNSRPVQSIPCY